MRDSVIMFAAMLLLLGLGGSIPGGTYWLTPVASLLLLAVTYFGRHSPAALLHIVDRDWRALRQLTSARTGAGLFRITLLLLPIWGIAAVGFVDYRPTAVRWSGEPHSARQADPTVRRAFGAVRVWEERDSTADQYAPEHVVIETAEARLALLAQANDGPLGTYHPAVEVEAWGWADADLLPETVVTVYPAFRGAGTDAPRTYYVSLLNGTIREQAAWLGMAWTIFYISFPLLAAAMTIWALRLAVGWLMRRGRSMTANS